MGTKDEQLIVFDIKNCQEHYAVCLEFIQIYEDEKITKSEKLKKLLELNNIVNAVLRDFDAGAALRWLEEPMQRRGQSIRQAQEFFAQRLRNSAKLDEDLLISLLEDKKELHYHLRIHMEFDGQDIQMGNLVHFQYLALLLERLLHMGFFKKKIQKEISVFLVPASGDVYPFLDQNGMFDEKVYNVVSQYLRMIANKYKGVIFCVDKKIDRIWVSALETHSTRGCESYFPAILVDKKMYNRIFDPDINMPYYEALKSARGLKANGNFGEALDRDPMVAMPDFITKTSYKRMIKVLGTNIEDVFRLMKNKNKRSIMQFCLFAFLISNEKNLDDTWKVADEIEKGIRQIVQNAVQHSEVKECVFSFYLHEKKEEETKKDFIDRISLQYPGVYIEPDQELAALEIFISDLNEKQDMLECFSSCLQEDIRTYLLDISEQFSGHQMLIDNINKISICNLFSEFSENDLKDAWVQFRKQDLVAHVGLSLFGLTAERCKAAIKVVSCKQPIVTDEKNKFYKAYGNREVQENHAKGIRIIPGTQFSIMIPIRRWSQIRAASLGQLVLYNHITEDYESFAQSLAYSEKRLSITRKEEKSSKNGISRELLYGGNMGIRKEKDVAVKSWFTWWSRRLKDNCDSLNKEKQIYNHDFGSVSNDEYFKSADHIEVCIKGLLMSLNKINNNAEILYLALTNLPEGFIKTFCSIAVLIGVREFPQNVQIYLKECEIDDEPNGQELVLTGRNYMQVMYYAYILSIEHGSCGCSYQDYKKTAELYKRIYPYNDMTEGMKTHGIRICPFDVLLSVSPDSNESLFEQKISFMAESELDGTSTGYKLSSTHMRLGSKVHIESFYEMSFLFYRTSIANRIAFLILKDLQKKADIIVDLKKDAIIFYGYASYSKAILTSLTEILRLLRLDEDKKRVGFASYQHDLQSDSSDVQMYFGLESNSFGKVDQRNNLQLEEAVKVIQIVPISSTLTTFGKMWSEFCRHLKEGEKNNQIKIYGNYTVFWVVDRESEDPAVIPSNIEEKYWKSVTEKKIETTFSVLMKGGCNCVKYFIASPVVWHNPLKCKLCFPENVIEEIPLVETDQTSTIPTQQIRYKTKKHSVNPEAQEFKKQIIRLSKLSDCIMHGHIIRRQNHYQYYIDTQRYFYNVKGMVKDWLLNDIQKDNKELEIQTPILHIIFSPEHNTNVGFSQYVNTYYFGGLAEIVSINVDKEYRSNFICEHAALMKTIEYLHKADNMGSGSPVRFYFVDDTIITGETLEKANSFLHSLLPSDSQMEYHANLFDKIFVLVDRLSNDTKRMYVENIERNFCSFVHIDVSNIRTQGDSCVGCKLEQNTKKMFKRSATRSQAGHWAAKLYDYRKIRFDDLKQLEKIDREQSYYRMVIYHVLQNVIVKNGRTYTVGDAYDTLLDLMEWFLSKGIKGNIYGYQALFSEMDELEGIKNILKIICRPFFSFDYKIKLQVLTLYVFLTECILNTPEEQVLVETDKKKSRKLFMYESNRKERTGNLAKNIQSRFQSAAEVIDFLSEYMFEGLTEMGSTYLMRKQTIQKVYQYISEIPQNILVDEADNKFWGKYALNIHRILSNTKDETKELWLEYLYSTGHEYEVAKEYLEKENELNVEELPQIYTEIVKGEKKNERNESFRHFVLELFFQNTGINFDGIEKKEEINASDEYFMESWKEIRKLGRWVLRCSEDTSESASENKLFSNLKNAHKPKEKNKRKVKEWYGEFLQLVAQMCEEKYDIKSDDINIILMTENYNHGDTEDIIQRLDIINEWIGSQMDSKAVTRYRAKQHLAKELGATESKKTAIERDGYVLHDECGKDKYFILFFDNPEEQQGEYTGRSMKSLARVFLYMSIKKREDDTDSVGIRYIMRDILAYRNRLLCMLEQDFYGDTFINYARTNEERNILSHEKAASHSASTDDEISVEIFVRKDLSEKNIYKYLDDNQKAHWLLIRNYSNNQIAKLFNRSFTDDTVCEIPPLYLADSVTSEKKYLFGHKLVNFGELGINNSKEQDGRFEWLQKIMDIDILLKDTDEFTENEIGERYNQEYFRCILVDILISAIKYQSYQDDFLLRIEQFMEENAVTENTGERVCKVKIYREETKEGDTDYMIIENPVDKLAHGLIDWEGRNELIKMHLNDPLDFIDGHMSLLAIKRYIERLGATKIECKFFYSILKDEDNKKILVFKTCLPVLKKKRGKMDEKSNILD